LYPFLGAEQQVKISRNKNGILNVFKLLAPPAKELIYQFHAVVQIMVLRRRWQQD